MNEFIIWDKKQKKFRALSSIVYNTSSIHDIKKEDIDIKLVNCWGSPFNDDGEQNPDILVQREKGKFTIHKLIKIDDTLEQNKIYADCSIVEWNHQDNKYIGYFSFNRRKLRYEVVSRDYNNDVISLEYAYLNMKNIKVIGTLQEDKHLLEN